MATTSPQRRLQQWWWQRLVQGDKRQRGGGSPGELEPILQKKIQETTRTLSLFADDEDDDDLEDTERTSYQSSSYNYGDGDCESSSFEFEDSERSPLKIVQVDIQQEEKQQVSLFHIDNLAIPTCYLVFGMTQGLVRTFLNVYPLDLGATEAQQTTLASITTLPCALKILYGFTTDNVPIFGYRRKPYIFLGWFLASCLAATLLWTSDLTLTYDKEEDSIHHHHQAISPPDDAPSMTFLSLIFFLLGFCIWFADATCDAVVAEKTQSEPDQERGSMQSSCYVARYCGILIASSLSTWLYAHAGPQSIVTCIMSIPWILLFPLLYWFREDQNVVIQPVSHQCREIWNTICSQSVWEPMAFIYIFNLLQVPNPAWRQFLCTVYGFTSIQLNLLVVTAYALLLTGVLLYKCCFLQTSWRRIFVICMLLNGVFSSLQLLLIRGMLPTGWSPFWFALGDDALVELTEGLRFLPASILMLSLCPVGSEGVSYAMLTTLDNSAQMLSPAISTILLGIWDTSKQALETGQVNGLFNLSILTTAIQLSPMICIGWMPRNRDELYALADKPWSGSPVSGVVILFVLGSSMVWTLTISLLNIMNPGWNGGS